MRKAALCLLWAGAHAFSQSRAVHVEFGRDIQPILDRQCVGCHNAQMATSGLRLDSAESARKGGGSGPGVVPGKSAESALLQRVTSTRKGHRMPPVGPGLAANEVALLTAWIDQGAQGPSGPVASSGTKPKGGHWAFYPVEKPSLPEVRQRAWVRNPVDAFVLARLERESLTPSGEASKTTLLRRVSLDLTGLPPTPQEVSEFLQDSRADAYERQVDRLLASPHYGERWARPWLDLARYADSDGYEKDLARPYAWRYRQWVIDALNRDLPFDQFTMEQIAGDLLPNATVEQRVATGFHRNALYNREGGVSRAEARFEQVVNRTNSVGTVWLGLTVGCAQCHNHKYDPISQKEFYQLKAYFDRTADVDIEAPMPGEIGPFLQSKPAYEKARRELLAHYEMPALQAEYEAKLTQALKSPGADPEADFLLTAYVAMVENAEAILLAGPSARTPKQARKLADFMLTTPLPEWNRDSERAKALKEVRAKLKELDAAFSALTEAMVTAENPNAPPARIALKGDYREPGAEVQPGTLAVLPPLPAGAPKNRLALARWLVSREHPLTSRVTVNRAWQELFGKGLVRTSEDFGTQGEKPSDPELLDWLAAEFMEKGWSQKALHRLIVTSATYRQSSRVRPEVQAKDPENRLLARQSRLRLPAELVRDAALASSGLLNPAVGGPSVRPPQPVGVAELSYGSSVKWPESTGRDRYRRGLYIHYQRTTPYPLLANFDAPDSTVTCSRRQRTNTPLQALNLLNDPVFFEAAQALAVRLAGETGSDGDRIERGFAWVLGRKPTPREKDRVMGYLTLQRELVAKEGRAEGLLGVAPEEAAWVGVGRVMLNLDEFLTRE